MFLASSRKCFLSNGSLLLPRKPKHSIQQQFQHLNIHIVFYLILTPWLSLNKNLMIVGPDYSRSFFTNDSLSLCFFSFKLSTTVGLNTRKNGGSIQGTMTTVSAYLMRAWLRYVTREHDQSSNTPQYLSHASLKHVFPCPRLFFNYFVNAQQFFFKVLFLANVGMNCYL